MNLPTVSGIQGISIEKEMQRSYLDYAMSVIVSRAIPDARDGLKPVHRRILYAMHESSCDYNKPYRKSARIVGEVMGKYHPHGDSAIYDALVRMAQNFSLRLPLIDGQGNFGSMDGDSAAAMRYTESRLEKVAHTLLEDIDKETVTFQENYDGSEREPIVLPSRFPNLLVNGAGGIAVGMATNIPPHNLGEVIDATIAYIANPDITNDELFAIVPGPDFPTGGTIIGRAGSYSAVTTGRGSVIIRAKTFFEPIDNQRTAIIITEIPYQVNKAKLVEKIAELVKEKRIEGISDLRDESDKDGVRVVVELKRDVIPEVLLNQLFTYTPLQTSFGVNMLALDRGRPGLMNLKEVLRAFATFREEVITSRTRYLLQKARDRAHVLIGLSMAVANIDEVITMIKAAPNPQEAREALMARDWPAEDVIPLITLVADTRNKVAGGKCYFTETQARAILDMKLQRLTGLEKEKIDSELQELRGEITGYLEVLASREKLLQILKEELIEIKESFANPRRTTIEEAELDNNIEDLIQEEDMVVTVTSNGYVKRVPLETYRAQKRGGKGRSGIAMREEEITTELFVASTHASVLFFSNIGKVYKLKVYKLPQGTPQSKGRALINIFPLQENETITNVMPLPDEEHLSDSDIMFATANGNIRRNSMSDFENVMANGKIAIRLDDDDNLIGVAPCTDTQHILLSARSGKCLRFPVDAVRVFKSRTSSGVRGMKLAKGDKVMSLSVLSGAEQDTETRDQFLRIPSTLRCQLANSEESEEAAIFASIRKESDCSLDDDTIRSWAKNEEFILTITENGFGKRSSAYEYRITNRGGQGIVNIATSKRNGPVIASFPVDEDNQIILITDKGKLIRCPISDIRIAGRNTQGVTIFKTAANEKAIAAIRLVEQEDTNDSDTADETSEAIDSTTEIGNIEPDAIETDAAVETNDSDEE